VSVCAHSSSGKSAELSDSSEIPTGAATLMEAGLARLKAWADGPRTFPGGEHAAQSRQAARHDHPEMGQALRPEGVSREGTRFRVRSHPREVRAVGVPPPAADPAIEHTGEARDIDPSWLRHWLDYAKEMLPKSDQLDADADLSATEEHEVYAAVEKALRNSTEYERSHGDFVKRLVEEAAQRGLDPYRRRKAAEARSKWLADARSWLLLRLGFNATLRGVALAPSDEQEAVEELEAGLSNLPTGTDPSETITEVVEVMLEEFDEKTNEEDDGNDEEPDTDGGEPCI